MSSMVFRATRPFHPARLHKLLSAFTSAAAKRFSPDEKTDSQTEAKGDAPPALPKASDGASDGPESAAFRGVIRSKGEIWLANAWEKAYSWHSAGCTFDLKVFQRPYMARFIENEMGVMMIGEAFEGLHDNAEKREQRLFEMVYRIFDAKTNAMEAIQDHLKLGKWTYTYGDRASELVLIGVNLNHAAIRGALEGALLTKAEMSSGVESWERFLPSHHRLCRQFCTPPYYTTPSWRGLAYHIATQNAARHRNFYMQQQQQRQRHLHQQRQDESTNKRKKIVASENVGIVVQATSFKGMEEAAKLVHAKGVLWERGEHPLGQKVCFFVCSSLEARFQALRCRNPFLHELFIVKQKRYTKLNVVTMTPIGVGSLGSGARGDSH